MCANKVYIVLDAGPARCARVRSRSGVLVSRAVTWDPGTSKQIGNPPALPGRLAKFDVSGSIRRGDTGVHVHEMGDTGRMWRLVTAQRESGPDKSSEHARHLQVADNRRS